MSAAPPPPYSEKYPQPPPPLSTMYPGVPPVLGEYPTSCRCIQCGQQIATRTEKKGGILAWLLCAGMFLFGLWCCCFIPFCIDSCKDTHHYCPSCGTLLGVHKVI